MRNGFLSVLLENIDEGIIACNNKGKPILFNKAAKEMLGLTLQDIPVEKLADYYNFYLPDSNTPMTPEEVPFLRALKGESIKDFEMEIRPQDDEKVILLVNGRSFFNKKGKKLGAVVAMRDITKGRKIKGALETSLQHFEAIYNSQLDAIVCTDLDGCITESNSSMHNLFGYDPDELIGRRLWILLAPDVSYERITNKIEALEEPEPKGYELKFQRKNGEVFSGMMMAALLCDGDGNKQGHTVMIRDQSEAKQAEAELVEKQKQLAESREEERLRMARELHDGIIQDLLSLSYQFADDSPQVTVEPSKLRNELLKLVARLRGFVNELRPINLEELGLVPALEAYIDDLKTKKALELKIDLLIEECTKLPNPLELCIYRAVQELLNNVIKHARATWVKISLRCFENKVLLLVEDNGYGFSPPENLADLSQQQHFGLVGLVERVELLDGMLGIRSKENEGTEVSITLPLENTN